MRTSVDRFGRVVIPKQARDRAGIGPGTELEVVVSNDGVTLRPVEEGPVLVNIDGVLVFTGEPIGDLESALAVHRRQRLTSLAGGARP